ncbi:MAG: UDP-3-O-acyl-N-acetylglucosamine deacetylase [Pirellula sp.]
MTTAPMQTTIAHLARVSGRGYWSGNPVNLTLRPASQDSGIVFRRIDLPNRPEVAGQSCHRVDTNLRTKLIDGSAAVEMVEHVMAALYGMGIDNCIVECDACEMPGLDGSAMAIALAIENAGIEQLATPVRQYRITETIRIVDQHAEIVAIPSQSDGLTVAYHLDYGTDSPIPASTSRFAIDPDEFLQNIAPARTFLPERDASELQRMGVAQHVTYRDLVVFGESGPIENTLRFPDECSRHKLLDVIGDLALCGVRLHGTVIARRSGHNLNGKLAEQLRLRYAQRLRSHSRAA